MKRTKSGGNKMRYLWAIFTTTEGDPAPVGGDPADDPAPSDPPAGDPPAGDPPASSWMDALAVPEDQREAFKDLTNEQVLERLNGPKAPEAYEFTLPEGVTAEAIDQASYDGFTGGLSEIAKKHGLPQDAVNEIAGFATRYDVDRQAEAGPQAIEQAKTLFGDELKAWKSEVGATKAQEAITASDKAIAGFVSPAFLKILDDTGLRHSPDVIQTFAKIGEVIGEDSLPKPHPSTPDGADDRAAKLKQLYPSMAK